MSRRATFRNGRVELKPPADWPAGEALGIRGKDWPQTPEEKEDWLKLVTYDSDFANVTGLRVNWKADLPSQ